MALSAPQTNTPMTDNSPTTKKRRKVNDGLATTVPHGGGGGGGGFLSSWLGYFTGRRDNTSPNASQRNPSTLLSICQRMAHPTKKQRLNGRGDDVSLEEEAKTADQMAMASSVGTDVLANIFGYLDGPKDIMQKRRVCKKWKEAVKQTTSPLVEFNVDGMENYNAMRVMSEAMPNLQQIKIGGYDADFLKYNDGEDPDERWVARTANQTAHDIEIIANFSKLRILKIDYTTLNGKYPFFFNSFPLLQKLSIVSCYHLKWDLEMLAGLPLLKELDCGGTSHLTGNINSLRVLKETLEVVVINGRRIEGGLMDLADFPRLKKLDLDCTAVTGDIRDISENDFSSLEQIKLPKGVYGGFDYELERLSDAPDLVRTVYLLKKQRPALKYRWFATLSKDSLDWYGSLEEEDEDETPPFYILFVQAGSRIGYQWQTNVGNPCEVNWLEPEPDRESSDYEKYIKDLQAIQREVGLYRGLHQPPTEEEYNRLIEEYYREEEDAHNL